MARGDAATRATPLAMHMVRLPDVIRYSAFVIFATFFLLAIALLFVPWVQTAVSTGKIIAYAPDERELDVVAPIKGQIDRWHVREGDMVSAGDLLVELRDNDPDYSQRLAEQRDLAGDREKAARDAIDATQDKLDSLERVRTLSLDAMDAKIRMSRHQVTAAQRALAGASISRSVSRPSRSRVPLRLSRVIWN